MSDTFDFALALDRLGVAIFTASPVGLVDEFIHPPAWSSMTPDENADRIARYSSGDAVCGVMGGLVAVVDVDPRNGGDIEAVRQLLAALSVRIFAEVATPGEGRHFYIAGHPDLATAHKLTGYPGVDVLSFSSNVFLPGTRRPKYDGRGYEIVSNNLAALADGGDPDGAEQFTAWVADHRPKAASFTPAPPWNGTPPDARQAAYLTATLSNHKERISALAPDSGRNVALFNSAMSCGNYIAGAGMDETEAIGALTDAATACGLLRDDGARSVQATIRSGLGNGRTRPRAVPEPKESGWIREIGHTSSAMQDVGNGIGRSQAKDETGTPVLAELLTIVTASDVQIGRVAYTWAGRIPIGAMTLMPGEEGIGKTTLGIRLISDLTRGLLAGEHCGTPRDVLVVATEDGLADVFTPRLREAGAGLTRVHFVKARIAIDGSSREVIVPRDLDVLGLAVRKYAAAVVWIDSLVTTLPDEMKSISYKDTAKVLRALGTWAETERISVAAPWHLNKSSGSDTAIRIMDSRAFRTAVRAMLLIVADPDAAEGSTQGIVALDKANAGTLSVPALRYRIRSAPYIVSEVDEDTGEIREIATSCGVADWLGEVEGDGREIARSLLMPRIEQENSPVAWLREYLTAAGDTARQDVIAAALEAGFSKGAMERAAARLGVRSVQQSGQQTETGRPWRKAVWSLPPKSPHPCPTGGTEATGETQREVSEGISAGQAQSPQSPQSPMDEATWDVSEAIGKAPYITRECPDCCSPLVGPPPGYCGFPSLHMQGVLT